MSNIKPGVYFCPRTLDMIEVKATGFWNNRPCIGIIEYEHYCEIDERIYVRTLALMTFKYRYRRYIPLKGEV